MKKLLFQFDTDPRPSVFDTVVAYDGGADHVIGYSNCNPGMITPLVEGTIFTRSEKNKKNTAIFIGGSDINKGDELLDAVKKIFFSNFRVSLMLDSNGCNTTAAAAVASILKSGSIADKQAVILAGTGPVGSRAAVMMAREGARVSITSRNITNSVQTCDYLKEHFDVEVEPAEAATIADRAKLIETANIVMATGAAGVQLLDSNSWSANKNIEFLVDANAVPPLGIAGIEMTDRGEDRNGKISWGAIGLGPAKLSLQRECIASLFQQNDLVLDADEILKMAREKI